MKEWRTQVKCCTIVYSYVLWCPEFNEGLTNRKILSFLGIPKSESIIVSLVYTGIAQKGNWGSNPVQARFFSGFLFATAKVASLAAMIFFSFITNIDALSGEHRGWYCSCFFWGICARPKSKSRNPHVTSLHIAVPLFRLPAVSLLPEHVWDFWAKERLLAVCPSLG